MSISSPTGASDTGSAATEDVVVVILSSSSAVGAGGDGGGGWRGTAVSVAATNFCHCFVAGFVLTTVTMSR